VGPVGLVEMLLNRLRQARQARGVESTGVRRRLHQLASPFRRLAAAARTRPVALVDAAPSPQHALDLFRGEWAGAMPAPCDAYEAGRLPLFADARVEWAIAELGGVSGRTVLQCGPMEGAHTWLLEQRGAAGITAIEAHPRAYLRALVAKEVLGLTRARFLLGDFVKYLQTTDARFDVGVASGVLYHMTEPVELLWLLARACDGLYLWTHYYDAQQIVRRPNVHARFKAPETRTVRGFTHQVHPYFYEAERYQTSFCGGTRPSSAWLDRETLLECLRVMGFATITVAFEEADHIHGPSLALVARK
jgi:hypothetical protein